MKRLLTQLRFDCCTCPHVTYLTISVSRSEHECFSCGARFIDAQREKVYWGKGPP